MAETDGESMATGISRNAGWRLGLVVALAAFLLCAMLVMQGDATLADDDLDTFVFLPLLTHSLAPGIHGRVTYLGEPAPGITVTLWYYASKYGERPFQDMQTQEDGGYHFTALPELYMPYVQYYNGRNGNPAYLRSWRTGGLADYYMPGDVVYGWDFDIADIHKLAPTTGAEVPFPVTFTWEPRPATPQDDYYFEIHYPVSLYQPWFSTGNLGYVGSFTWQALGNGFEYGQEYVWNVKIRWPDGSSGSGYTERPVYFSP